MLILLSYLFYITKLRGNITGGNFAPPKFATYLMNIISVVHVIVIAFFFLGDSIWKMLGINTPPALYQTCKDYPVQTLVTIFLVVPSFAQSFMTTGAFEVMCNGQVIFSKLETGRFPNGVELVDMFKTFGLMHAN
jgi:selT/selW/selH-like putative selenoprotein